MRKGNGGIGSRIKDKLFFASMVALLIFSIPLALIVTWYEGSGI